MDTMRAGSAKGWQCPIVAMTVLSLVLNGIENFRFDLSLFSVFLSMWCTSNFDGPGTSKPATSPAFDPPDERAERHPVHLSLNHQPVLWYQRELAPAITRPI